MSPEQMLRELATVARKLGLDVRFEALEHGGSRRGGLCTLRGKGIVVVDAHATTIDKVGILCEALARHDVETVYVPPLLRARIQRSM